MSPQERLDLAAYAKAGHCALMLVAESGESDALIVLRAAIRAFVSAAVALDYEQARAMLREIELKHFTPRGPHKLQCVVSNTGEILTA